LRPRADEPPRPTLVGVPTAAERSRTYGQRRWPVASATAPPQPPPRLDIARIGATDGSALRLLLDGSRDHVNVVAICDAAHRERVADALLRARIALDARGIALHTRLLESR
jgi:hypothetical protein